MRLKRARNPDMVCLERLQEFLEDMQRHGVIVLLCGVRVDFAQAMTRLGFHDWLPSDRIYLEEPAGDGEGAAMTSTLRAVKRAYEILGADLCPSCPRRQEAETDRGWSYMI